MKMICKGFNAGEFYNFLAEKYHFNRYKDTFTVGLLDNIVGYAHANEHIVKDQFAQFITDMVPGVTFLEVASFCEDKILTDSTLAQLGRKRGDNDCFPKSK
jgi:hypothetical protein